VASEAGVGQLTLVHLNPTLRDPSPLFEDAQAVFDRTNLGRDMIVLV
jgi:ribonuclease BN (tRNA processing enzyme)